jgi:ABC-type multidrug transport system permease subunit
MFLSKNIDCYKNLIFLRRILILLFTIFIFFELDWILFFILVFLSIFSQSYFKKFNDFIDEEIIKNIINLAFSPIDEILQKLIKLLKRKMFN